MNIIQLTSCVLDQAEITCHFSIGLNIQMDKLLKFQWPFYKLKNHIGNTDSQECQAVMFLK